MVPVQSDTRSPAVNGAYLDNTASLVEPCYTSTATSMALVSNKTLWGYKLLHLLPVRQSFLLGPFFWRQWTTQAMFADSDVVLMSIIDLPGFVIRSPWSAHLPNVERHFAYMLDSDTYTIAPVYGSNTFWRTSCNDVTWVKRGHTRCKLNHPWYIYN